MPRHQWMRVLGAVALAAACREPTGPASTSRVHGLLVAPTAACPTPVDFVVSAAPDESGLRAAIAAASPGQVIGIDGRDTVLADIVITTPGITITCATPGSGLVPMGSGVSEMLQAAADGIVVDRLILQNSSGGGGPYQGSNASGLRLTRNQVWCGDDCGVFAGNTPNAVVSDNEFISYGSFTGLHMQQGIDGSRVERNTFTANAPSGSTQFGALRIRDGVGVTIVGNVVRGPWQNSLALADLSRATIALNRVQGAVLYGIQARSGAGLLGPISMSNNLFLSNQITGAGVAGILLVDACRNQLIGNALQGNAGNMGVIFSPTTGANLLVGANNALVTNNGAFDCNADGRNDPNIIVGPHVVPAVASMSAQLNNPAAIATTGATGAIEERLR